jgi:integrase
MLERHREAMGNPATGPIFANGAGKAFDLDSLYRHQMKERLEQTGIEWEGWHGFRRGLATNLERIGVRESIAAVILRHTNERVTRKHYIKPPSIEARAAMRLLSEAFSNVGSVKLLPKIAPQTSQKSEDATGASWVQ